MTTSACVCGYAARDPGGLTDHFEEVFTPADDVGRDGRVHDQVARDRAREFAQVPDGGPVPPLVCLCGFGTGEHVGFDNHLLSMFITPGRIGPDGRKHAPAPEGVTDDGAGA